MDRTDWLAHSHAYEKRCLAASKLPEGPERDKALESLRAEYQKLRADPKAQPFPTQDSVDDILAKIDATLILLGNGDDVNDWSVWLDAGAVGEPPPTSKPRLRELAERLAWHRRDDGKAIDDEWLPAASPTELAECFDVTITTLKRWDGAKLRIDKVTAKRWRVNAADAERLGYKPKARRVNAADAEPIK